MEEALLEIKGCHLLDICIFAFPTTVTSSDKMQRREERIYFSSWYDSAVPTRWGLYHSRQGGATVWDTEAAGLWFIVEDQEVEREREVGLV